jgi:cell fate (sporulation/competence/biofilm development) regulator YmcA (YheA/YmcA/DUF963 family)
METQKICIVDDYMTMTNEYNNVLQLIHYTLKVIQIFVDNDIHINCVQ